MAGLPKSYFKRFPGNMKAAWKAFKKERGQGGSAPKHHKRAKAKKNRAPTRHPNTEVVMAKKKGRKRAAVKHAARRVGHKVRAAAETRPGKLLIMAGTAAASGVATSYAINHIPKVKDMDATVKSGIQGALGLAAIFLGKKKWIKSVGAGAVIAGVMGLTKSVLKLDPLAGPGAGKMTLPPDVLAKLIRNGSMSMPASVSMHRPASVAMNRPASVAMRGRGSSGWGGVSF